jgi:hypothetical protein
MTLKDELEVIDETIAELESRRIDIINRMKVMKLNLGSNRGGILPLVGLSNKPSNWLDLWTGWRMRAWDSRMRAEVIARQNKVRFHFLVRRHIQRGGVNDAS